jgi:PAS domain S-box-containing protein
VAFDYIIYSRAGIIVEAHGDVERMLGRKPGEIVGRPILDFIAPSGQPIVREKIGQNIFGTYETALVRPDGKPSPHSSSPRPRRSTASPCASRAFAT